MTSGRDYPSETCPGVLHSHGVAAAGEDADRTCMALLAAAGERSTDEDALYGLVMDLHPDGTCLACSTLTLFGMLQILRRHGVRVEQQSGTDPHGQG